MIVAPIVAIALAVAVRSTNWGLSMRAMSENADSARLSGVWIRRTSTLTWTVAGALSAFNAILNAPGQTSALTQALSPDLLLFALTAALIGAMVNLTVAFVAGIGVGIFYELLQWNTLSSNNATAIDVAIFYALILVVLLIRVRAMRKGTRTAAGSTWSEGGKATVARQADRLRQSVSVSGVWLALGLAVLLPFVLDIGRTYLFSQICIYAVIALSLTVLTGWAGQVSLGQFGLVAVGALMAAHLGNSVPAPAPAALRRRRDGRGGHRHRAARAAHAGPLPGGQHPGLRVLHAAVGAGHHVLDPARAAQDAVHRAARPGFAR